MRIAVTGSSGRIGRAIHRALCPDHEVIGVDRSVASVTSQLGDIGDYAFLARAFRGAEAVVHTAALHAPHVRVFSDSEFQRINVEATENVVRAGRSCGARQLVFTSTTALYGQGAQHPDEASWVDETTVPQPRTIYHRTKLEAEKLLESEAGPDLQVTSLRMSRCFPETAALMAVYRLHRGVDARDVAEGHRLALAGSEEPYRMFILSGATPFRRDDCKALKQSAAKVLRERCPALVEQFESRGWTLPRSIDRVYDSSRAQRRLGWKPKYDFEDVIRLLDAAIPEVLPESTGG